MDQRERASQGWATQLFRAELSFGMQRIPAAQAPCGQRVAMGVPDGGEPHLSMVPVQLSLSSDARKAWGARGVLNIRGKAVACACFDPFYTRF